MLLSTGSEIATTSAPSMWLRSRRCSPPIIPLPINPYLMVSLTRRTVLPQPEMLCVTLDLRPSVPRPHLRPSCSGGRDVRGADRVRADGRSASYLWEPTARACSCHGSIISPSPTTASWAASRAGSPDRVGTERSLPVRSSSSTQGSVDSTAQRTRRSSALPLRCWRPVGDRSRHTVRQRACGASHAQTTTQSTSPSSVLDADSSGSRTS